MYHDWIIFEVWGLIFGWSRCRRCKVQATPTNHYEECPK